MQFEKLLDQAKNKQSTLEAANNRYLAEQRKRIENERAELTKKREMLQRMERGASKNSQPDIPNRRPTNPPNIMQARSTAASTINHSSNAFKKPLPSRTRELPTQPASKRLRIDSDSSNSVLNKYPQIKKDNLAYPAKHEIVQPSISKQISYKDLLKSAPQKGNKLLSIKPPISTPTNAERRRHTSLGPGLTSSQRSSAGLINPSKSRLSALNGSSRAPNTPVNKQQSNLAPRIRKIQHTEKPSPSRVSSDPQDYYNNACKPARAKEAGLLNQSSLKPSSSLNSKPKVIPSISIPSKSTNPISKAIDRYGIKSTRPPPKENSLKKPSSSRPNISRATPPPPHLHKSNIKSQVHPSDRAIAKKKSTLPRDLGRNVPKAIKPTPAQKSGRPHTQSELAKRARREDPREHQNREQERVSAKPTKEESRYKPVERRYDHRRSNPGHQPNSRDPHKRNRSHSGYGYSNNEDDGDDYDDDDDDDDDDDSLKDFVVDDEDEDYGYGGRYPKIDYRSEIRKITGYDSSKYNQDYDDGDTDDMEANASAQLREENVSLKIAKIEDKIEEDRLRKEEEARKKRLFKRR